MSSKYVDTTAIMQVIGSVFNDPSLLDLTDRYSINDEDFPDQFHKIAFGAIYKLHEQNMAKITLDNIVDFLRTRPKSYAVFEKQKGEEWFLQVSKSAFDNGFDYYYHRLKKFTLLRAYDAIGLDLRDIYDVDNIFDTKKKEQQEEWLDKTPLEEIADIIDDKILSIRLQYVDDDFGEATQAGEGMLDLIDRFKKNPEVGVPLYGPLINTITRGARLKKLYLRSGATGTGKSRTMVADACYIGCNRIYDENFGWIKNGSAEPVLFITTEQETEEVQTMMLAFLSNVNEENILNGTYKEGEEERVREAARIFAQSPIYIEELPDFSLQDIENKIKKNIRDHDISYCFFDYIHSSIKILSEITRKAGGVKLREDNILFMLSIRLKDLCNQYGIFIMSGTQLNGDWKDSESPDQNLLRGAKSIADKIDFGAILLPVEEKDLNSLETILTTNGFDTPIIKLSIYKNRRGRYKGVFLWCKGDLGTCRVQPMFCTTYNYEILNMEDMKIILEDEECAF